MKGNRLTGKRKHRRDVIILSNRGKSANLIWIHGNQYLCGVDTSSARALAYDLLKWARETEGKYKN